MAVLFTVTADYTKEVIDLAIKYKKQVKIGYVDKKGNIENRVCEPFVDCDAKNFGGWCHLRDQYRNFSYDRIVRIVLMDIDQTKAIEEELKEV